MKNIFLAAILENLVNRKNDIAVTEKGKTYTYSELNRISNGIYWQLVTMGVSIGDTVCVVAKRSFFHICAVIAILKVGAIYVPIDAEYPEPRKSEIIKDSQCKVYIDICSRKIYEIHGAINFECFQTQEEAVIPFVDKRKTMYIVYTSGTTGTPKGVEISYEALNNTLTWMCKAFTLSCTDVFAHKTSISFTDSIWEIYLPLAIGAKIAIYEQDKTGDIENFIAWSINEQITITQFVPSVLNIFLDILQESSPKKELSLRWVLLGGEHIDYYIAQKYFLMNVNFKVANTYGMTESAIYATCYILNKEIDEEKKYIATGYPIDNEYVYILDENEQKSLTNKPGEIVISGKSITKGYWRREDLSAEKIRYVSAVNKEVYFTGDVGYLDSKGCLWYLGRNDRQIKVNGQRIECEEVVKRISMIAKNSGRIEVLLCDGIYVCCTEIKIDWTRIRKILSRSIPKYMIPSVYVNISSFPYSQNGKLDIEKLREKIRSKLQEMELPCMEDSWVINELKDIIGHSDFESLSRIDDIGISSIQLTIFLLRLEKRGIYIKFAEIVNCETIADIVTLTKSKGNSI